ncbi:MAG: NADH-quinone oxidoreductase subunit NuoE [Hyphomicrobiaceae bacterium]
MAVRRLNPEQPTTFEFSPENRKWAEAKIKDYPEGKQASAVIPLLWRAQEQHGGWLPEPAIRTVAEMLNMPIIRVYEVATFYTMFQLAPVGKKAHIQVCGTTPCMLRGSGDLIAACKTRIAQTPHTLSDDGNFSWEEVECLGSCANAPMVQIWKDTYEDLTPETFEKVLDGFDAGDPPKPGSQTGRTASCPSAGATSLTSPPIATGISRMDWQDAPTALANDNITGTKKSGPQSGEAMQKPELLEAARDGKPDDLKRISGVGPKLEQTLNQLGVFHYDQIAGWSAEAIAWVDDNLKFKGRIERDDWIGQAKTLAAGGETEFAKRVDDGEVDSSKD